jgi:outer membrane biosynthesis protein TonB
MIIPLALVLLSLLKTQNKNLLNPSQVSSGVSDTCKKVKDTLTGRIVYLTADTEPACEGGRSALIRSINKTGFYSDSLVTGEIDTRYTVSFIIEVNGKVSGGRVVHGSTKQIADQILKAVKNCRWFPGKCNAQKVPVLYSYSTIIEFSRN